MNEDKKDAIVLAYDLMYSKYLEAKRKRNDSDDIKKWRINMYKERLLSFQEVIICDLKIDCMFKEIK